MAESTQVGPVSPLMASVTYQGQAYYTSQYFHRQYLNNSPHGAKYQRHGDFLRVLRTAPLYDDYLRLGHIIELTWDDVRSIKSELTQNLRQWQPLFEEAAMHEATRRVINWMIDVRGEAPMVEELATADDVRSFVCGHVRWSDGTPGPAVELEDIDCTTVDWAFVLKVMHAAL